MGLMLRRPAPLAPYAGPVRRAALARIVSVVALTFVLAAPATSGSAQTADAFLVRETGHTLGGQFLAHWLAESGYATLGNPVSEVVAGERETQYFEYGVLVADDDGETVERLPAGAILARERSDPDARLAGKRVGGNRHVGAFLGTGDGTAIVVAGRSATVADRWPEAFAATEEDNGQDALGTPISALHLAYGKVTRWYDYGRLDAWMTEGAGVERALVGTELVRSRDVDLTPISADDVAGLLAVSGEALSLSGGDMTELASLDAEVASAGGFAYEAGGVFTPSRIQIPSIGVDAYIEQIGISADGVMGTPAGPMNVGWYSDVSAPGYGSNVVMAGHVDYYTVGPAVFAGLASLGGGETIYVTGPNGEGFTYAVTAAFSVSAYTDAGGILAGPGGESLTLITCGGSFNGVEYDSRTIIYAQRI